MTVASNWKRMGDQVGNHGWLLAAVWLVFLAFPLASIWSDPLSLTIKLVVTGLILAFAATYIHGFKTLDEGLHEDLRTGNWTAESASDSDINAEINTEINTEIDAEINTLRPSWMSHPGSLPHYIVLVAIVLVAFILGGWGVLGMMAFIVAFAMFHLSWPAAGFTVAIAIAITLIGPAIQGFLDDVWFFAATVTSISLFTAMIRLADERHVERTEFQTQLAISEDRSRVARDVHDVLGHSLTVVTLKAELCQRLLAMTPEDPDALDQARQELTELNAITRQALDEIRTTVGGLRTADLSDELAAARAVLSDAGVNLTVTGDHGDLPHDQRTVLAWVVRESVTNIVRHAQASSCEIAFDSQHNQASPAMRITDNGIGVKDKPEGNGLSGLRHRVADIGGTVRMSTPNPPATGTELEVLL